MEPNSPLSTSPTIESQLTITINPIPESPDDLLKEIRDMIVVIQNWHKNERREVSSSTFLIHLILSFS